MLTKRQENCMVPVWTVIFLRAGKRPTHGVKTVVIICDGWHRYV
jgi:hypothetical protein